MENAFSSIAVNLNTHPGVIPPSPVIGPHFSDILTKTIKNLESISDPNSKSYGQALMALMNAGPDFSYLSKLGLIVFDPDKGNFALAADAKIMLQVFKDLNSLYTLSNHIAKIKPSTFQDLELALVLIGEVDLISDRMMELLFCALRDWQFGYRNWYNQRMRDQANDVNGLMHMFPTIMNMPGKPYNCAIIRDMVDAFVLNLLSISAFGRTTSLAIEWFQTRHQTAAVA